jgi:molecular chaperone GrpE
MPKHDAQVEEKEREESAGVDSPETEAAETASEETALQAELESLRSERDQLKDQLLRAMADHQNFRKRTMQERQQLQQFATEALVRELLPVLDNFERTVAAVHQGATMESLAEGVKAVERQLRSALEAVNVTRIRAEGEQFDPEIHDALVTDENSDAPDGTVTAEIEAGYRMADRVIRPARVRVASRKK